MNRVFLGALGALLLVAAGFFWWQGRAEVERGVPPPDLNAAAPASDAPVDLPSAGPHGRGASLPNAAKAKESTEQRRFKRLDRNRDGRVTLNEFLMPRVKPFQKLDVNHDNLLSFEEWAVKTVTRFHEIDGNGDGVVTRDELDAYYARKDAEKAKHKQEKLVCSCPPLDRDDAPAGKGGKGKGSKPPADPDDD